MGHNFHSKAHASPPSFPSWGAAFRPSSPQGLPSEPLCSVPQPLDSSISPLTQPVFPSGYYLFFLVSYSPSSAKHPQKPSLPGSTPLVSSSSSSIHVSLAQALLPPCCFLGCCGCLCPPRATFAGPGCRCSKSQCPAPECGWHII